MLVSTRSRRPEPSTCTSRRTSRSPCRQVPSPRRTLPPSYETEVAPDALSPRAGSLTAPGSRRSCPADRLAARAVDKVVWTRRTRWAPTPASPANPVSGVSSVAEPPKVAGVLSLQPPGWHLMACSSWPTVGQRGFAVTPMKVKTRRLTGPAAAAPDRRPGRCAPLPRLRRCSGNRSPRTSRSPSPAALSLATVTSGARRPDP